MFFLVVVNCLHFITFITIIIAHFMWETNPRSIFCLVHTWRTDDEEDFDGVLMSTRTRTSKTLCDPVPQTLSPGGPGLMGPRVSLLTATMSDAWVTQRINKPKQEERRRTSSVHFQQVRKRRFSHTGGTTYTPPGGSGGAGPRLPLLGRLYICVYLYIYIEREREMMYAFLVDVRANQKRRCIQRHVTYSELWPCDEVVREADGRCEQAEHLDHWMQKEDYLHTSCSDHRSFCSFSSSSRDGNKESEGEWAAKDETRSR